MCITDFKIIQYDFEAVIQGRLMLKQAVVKLNDAWSPDFCRVRAISLYDKGFFMQCSLQFRKPVLSIECINVSQQKIS